MYYALVMSVYALNYLECINNRTKQSIKLSIVPIIVNVLNRYKYQDF